MITISFKVCGEPKTAGSKRAFPMRNGRIAIVDDNAKSKDWKQDVRNAAQAVYQGPLLITPLAVRFEFITLRPGNHWSAKGGVKPSAPLHKTTKPDVLKWARAIEDALSKVLYVDDAQIVCELLVKRYAEEPNGWVGCIVTIQELANVHGLRPNPTAEKADIAQLGFEQFLRNGPTGSEINLFAEK